MKKIILGLALSFFLLTAANAAEFNSNLKFGSKGSDVKKLQEFLAEQGLYSGPITGNFFSLTLKSVKLFQNRESIRPPSGFFGVLTRARANQILDEQLAASNEEAMNEPVATTPHTSLNDVVGKLNEQNKLLQDSLNLQKAEADRLRAEREAEAARLRAIADKADAEAVARQQAEQAARDLAAQQAAAEAAKPLYTPEQLRNKYFNHGQGGLNRLLYVITQNLMPVWSDGSTGPSLPSGETRTSIGYTFDVNFSRSGSYDAWGDARVVFNGKTVLTRDRDGYVSGLDWLGHYSFQIIYPSPGREDSVYEGTFKPPPTLNAQNWNNGY